jgi:RHS repeat-associated protein
MAYGATVTVGTTTRVLPHAVRSVTGTVNGVANPTYSYDANGNLTEGAGRTVSYQAFNLPFRITANGKTLTYNYDPEHQRIKETVSGTTAKETVYLNPANGKGLFYEKETVGATVTHRHFVSAGAATIAVVTQTGSTFATRYWHKDHLGSTVVVTDQSGAVIERLAYEPYGKRRHPNGLPDSANTLAGQSTDRGYTGHEHLDEVGLIHMNGRVYDPALGRFMTADPFVDSAYNLQSLNRYSYVNNNPLGYTDPSGHLKLKDIVKAVVAIAVAIIVGPEVTAFLTDAAWSVAATQAITPATLSSPRGLRVLRKYITSGRSGRWPPCARTPRGGRRSSRTPAPADP